MYHWNIVKRQFEWQAKHHHLTANVAANPSIIIVGAGIGGLTLALTLHQIGVPCVVLEQAPTLGPLGVGINIQPNAVRELYDLGIDDAALADIGIENGLCLVEMVAKSMPSLEASMLAIVGRNSQAVACRCYCFSRSSTD